MAQKIARCDCKKRRGCSKRMLFRCSLTSEWFNLTEFRRYVTLNLQAEAKTLRPRPKCLEAETAAESKNHEAEAEVEVRINGAHAAVFSPCLTPMYTYLCVRVCPTQNISRLSTAVDRRQRHGQGQLELVLLQVDVLAARWTIQTCQRRGCC